MNINKGTGAQLTIIGRLKEIPTMRQTQNDLSVSNITLAVDKYNYLRKRVKH